MCTRSYPEGSGYGEGADGVCDMDSSAENANSSDTLMPTRKARSRSVTAVTESKMKNASEVTCESFVSLSLKFSPNPTSFYGSAACVTPREEQFEDYGEGEDVDFTPSSPCPEEDTRTSGFSDLGSSLPSRSVAEPTLGTLSCVFLFVNRSE